jgi:hypothetical protein
MKSGRNVHDAGIIEATSNLTRPGNNPKLAADLNESSYFHLFRGHPGAWVCYDFKGVQLTSTHCSMLSYPAGPKAEHPKSWVIEAPMTGKEWTEIDKCDNDSQVNGSKLIGTWRVAKPTQCRFIRIRQTGPGHAGPNNLLLPLVEVFGIVHIP